MSPPPTTVRLPLTVPAESGADGAFTDVTKRKSGVSFSIAAATVKFFMFDAGIKYFSESLSKITLPVLSETILMPTRPRLTSGANNRCLIFVCSDSIVWTDAGVGAGVGVGVEVGPVTARGRPPVWPIPLDGAKENNDNALNRLIASIRFERYFISRSLTRNTVQAKPRSLWHQLLG